MKWRYANGITAAALFIVISAVPGAWAIDRDSCVRDNECFEHSDQRPGRRLSRDEQRDLQRNYDCWCRLSAREKNEYNARMSQFQRLPADRQKALRGNYARWKQMPCDRQNILRGRNQRWRSLPAEEKQRMREKVRCQRPCPM